jgi:voltage-gated potassium channel
VTAPESNDLKSTGYEIFIGLLSILSIFNIVLMYGFLKDSALQQILWAMNVLLTAIFMGDFIYRFTTSSARAGYFFRRFGWADLLSSVPFGQFKIFRLFRLVHVYRLLRDRGPKNVLDSLVRDRAGSALLTLLLAGILVLEFGSLSILRIEEYAPGGNIKTASDALWYVIVTISTVGYGDFYPVTNHGRFVGAIIIIVGVGIFGTFTGYLANIFLSPSKKKPVTNGATTPEAGLAKVAELKRLMAEQLAEIDELERALQEQRT